MTVKQLIEKLKDLPPDFDVVIDAGDVNMLYAQSVYQGSAWNVVISVDDND